MSSFQKSASPTLEQVAASAKVYLHNAESSNAVGYRATFALCDDADIEGFRQITKHRKGRAGGIYTAYLVDENQPLNNYKFEGLFLGWSASQAGAKIKFILSDEGTFDYFRMQEAGNKELAWMLVLVEMTDDSEPVDQEAKERVNTTLRGGPLCKKAAILCNDRMFLRWIGSIWKRKEPATPKEAAEFIRNRCRIQSRVELDHDEAAAMRFHKAVLTPYAVWSQ